MFGAHILILPPADQTTYKCEVNPVERWVSDVVCKRLPGRINAWAAQGQLERPYSITMVMLLLLCQLTAHSLMLQFVDEGSSQARRC